MGRGSSSCSYCFLLNLPNYGHISAKYCHPTQFPYFFHIIYSIEIFIFYLATEEKNTLPRMVFALFYPLGFMPFFGIGKMEINGYEKNALEILHVPFFPV